MSRAGRPKLTYELFLERARARHGDLYEYPTTAEFVGLSTKIPIECYKHGKFAQLAGNHISGSGCPKCGREASVQSLHDLRAGCKSSKRVPGLPPFGALGGLYKLPFWN